MKKQSAIIVKKVKKSGGEGHHGGAWKVAYADFVTAMMAFFLLMWLLNMTSEEKRARLTTYFKNFSIYDSGGTSFMEKSSEVFRESGETSQKAMQESNATTISNMKEMEQELKSGLMKQLGDAKDQVIIDTVEGGVRIQMVDKEGSLMFEAGSNKLTSKAKEILHVIGENINKLPNKVYIEGHTDATPYAKSDYSNWELSTERASSARRELEFKGLNPQRIDRVSGYADKDPLIKDNPQDPRNRRISIILKVPYIEETKTEKKIDTQKSSENISEKKDPGTLMINKFEENLSLIKKGMSEAEKKKEENRSGDKTNTAPVETADSVRQENKNWGAVIKKDEWNPVIKDGFAPVVNNGSSYKPVDNDSQNKKIDSKPVLKDIQVPAISKDTSKPVIKQSETGAYDYIFSKSKTKKNETKPALIEETKEAEKKPSIIKELANPIISKDDLFKK